jgi:hypothetical protein
MVLTRSAQRFTASGDRKLGASVTTNEAGSGFSPSPSVWAMSGGIIGSFGAKLLFEHIDIYKLSQGYLPMFPVTASVVALGMVGTGKDSAK